MTESVPFLDVGAGYRELRPEIDAAVRRVLESGWYILGRELEAFEAEYATYVGARHCVGVGNGLDALRLALIALDIGVGDEVIVPSNTYIATWLAISECGASIIPVEPVEGTYNLDPDRIESAITERTRALLPVHLYGQPVDLDRIYEIAHRHKLRVLEDAAQAHGATFKGSRIGGRADVVAWSFYPGKNLGAFGDAGAVTTDDDEIAQRIRRIRNYGSTVKYVHEEVGLNSRLDPMQAAILRSKLPYLDEWNQRRQHLSERYLAGLAETGLALPAVLAGTVPAWHVFVVRTPHRDALQRYLLELDIGTVIHYPVPPHLQAAYADLGYKRGAFPIAERIHDEVLSLPIGPHLSNEQQDRVIEAIRAWSTSPA